MIRFNAMEHNSQGFTLIELLVVISIISLLSSVVLTTVNSARMKARDARKIADFRSISTALALFFDANGRVPANYNPGSGACEGSTFYNQSMQELVTAGFLQRIPVSPGGGAYCYYDYGPGQGPGSIGALMVTTLEAVPNTTTGISPSCRPWPPAVNWCSQLSSKEYCICNTY